MEVKISFAVRAGGVTVWLSQKAEVAQDVTETDLTSKTETALRPSVNVAAAESRRIPVQSGTKRWAAHWSIITLKPPVLTWTLNIVQELCESRGGRPELSVLTSLLASVDVKIY